MEHQELCAQFVDLIKDVFPNHAEFNTWCDGSRMSCICRICWKLNDDKSRPNKPSKIILIVISHEALDDYNDGSTNEQQDAQERFKEFIKKKYSNFDPNHDTPKYQTPPTEEWLVITSLINK